MGKVTTDKSLGVALVVRRASKDGAELMFSTTLGVWLVGRASSCGVGKVDKDTSLGVALVSRGLSKNGGKLMMGTTLGASLVGRDELKLGITCGDAVREVDPDFLLGDALVVRGVSKDGDEVMFSTTLGVSLLCISSSCDVGKGDNDNSLGVALVGRGLSKNGGKLMIGTILGASLVGRDKLKFSITSGEDVGNIDTDLGDALVVRKL